MSQSLGHFENRIFAILRVLILLICLQDAKHDLYQVRDYIKRGCEPYSRNLSYHIDLKRDRDALLALPDYQERVCRDSWVKANKFFLRLWITLGVVGVIVVIAACCLGVFCCMMQIN
ncbi:MAG: hypothetical protein MHMPM18_003337 [Marteilia pararefringens]